MEERFYCFNFTNGQIQTQIDWMGRANGTSVLYCPPKLAKLVYCLYLSLAATDLRRDGFNGFRRSQPETETESFSNVVGHNFDLEHRF